MLDRVIQASAVGVAFWGIAITLLIGMDAKSVIQRLRKVGYYNLVVKYFGESLFACFSLLTFSVLLEPLIRKFGLGILSSVWIGVGVWTVATTLRTYFVLTDLLLRTAGE